MKNKIFILITLISLQILASFSEGDLLELTTALNARSSMNFYSNAKNFVKTLKKDTLLKVEESVEIKNSVNGKGVYGVRVTLHEEGKEKDPKTPSYWVYYDSKLKNPAMKIKERSKEVLEIKKLPAVIVSGKRKLTEANKALMDKLEPMAGDLAITMKDIQALIDMNADERAIRMLDLSKAQVDDWLMAKHLYCEILKEHKTKHEEEQKDVSAPLRLLDTSATIEPLVKPDVVLRTKHPELTPLEMPNFPEVKQPGSSEIVVKRAELDATTGNVLVSRNQDVLDRSVKAPSIDALKYDVTSNGVAPLRESSNSRITTSSPFYQKPDLKNVRIHYNPETKEVTSFSLENTKSPSLFQRIFSEPQHRPLRTFKFNFPDLARSDMSLSITDRATEKEFGTNYTHLVFLPRKQLPSVKQNKDNTFVTLSNGEELVFNKDNEITSGVLKELPQEVTGNITKKDRFVYNGSGVVITTQANNDEPTSNVSEKAGKRITVNRTAIIKKNGYNNCKVKVEELWDYDEKNGATFMKKEFATDEALDNFIKAKCNFSMFD